MKRIFISLTVILIATSLQAQHVALDAFFLKSKLDPDVNNKIILTNEVKELLLVYYPGQNINTLNTEFLNTQPFFYGIFTDQGANSEDKSHFKNFVSSVGNLNVTNFADGLAKFLVQRSKEELNIAFFRRFQEFLTRYPEVRIIFPATHGIISHLAAYNYVAMLPALRASFQKDLNTLSGNLINLRETTFYEGYNIIDTITRRADFITQYLNQTENGRSLTAGLILSDGLVKGTNLAEIISKLATDRVTTPNDNLSNSIQFMDLISNSLRSNEEGRIWINKKHVNDLVNDSITLRLYFGLLSAADRKMDRPLSFTVSNGNVSLQSFMKQLDEEWNSGPSMRFVQYVKNVAIAASEVADKSKKIAEIENENEVQILHIMQATLRLS